MAFPLHRAGVHETRVFGSSVSKEIHAKANEHSVTGSMM
jgi:hypothetical protein